MENLIFAHPVLAPVILGIIAIIFASCIIALLPLVGGKDTVFSRN